MAPTARAAVRLPVLMARRGLLRTAPVASVNAARSAAATTTTTTTMAAAAACMRHRVACASSASAARAQALASSSSSSSSSFSFTISCASSWSSPARAPALLATTTRGMSTAAAKEGEPDGASGSSSSGGGGASTTTATTTNRRREVIGRTAPGDKPRVVVLGTGWAAFSVIQRLDLKKYALTVMSPRSFFLFTPLLPSTTVGTLEFRGVIEPVRQVRGNEPLTYLQAKATGIDTASKLVTAEMVFDTTNEDGTVGHDVVDVAYDHLIIAVGGRPRTFEVPGVKDYTYFLRELPDARLIRNRMLECLERAANPALTQKERERLLHFVIVGGGPTCVEFAGELHDFLTTDARKYYPRVAEQVVITLVEAGDKLLSAFSDKLSKYTMDTYRKRNIDIRISTSVKEVHARHLVLSDGTEMPYGLCVWSTGVGPGRFVAEVAKTHGLAVDDRGFIETTSDLRVVGQDDVFALGDCMQIQGTPLPQTAQVAAQQGKHLVRAFNKGKTNAKGQVTVPPFNFMSKGMLAYVGGHKALFATGQSDKDFGASGFASWVLWNTAYITQLVSWRNKMMIPLYWFKSWMFGRDVARF